MKAPLIVIFSLVLSACSRMPEGIEPVTDFDINRYQGRWYEIARLDHRFERGLEQVTASYSALDDGTLRVVNRGFSTNSNEWEDAVGRARFTGDRSVGALEVSFFGFFFGDYVVFELDREDYQYAFVTGSINTLWFLSRTPTVDDALKERFIRLTRDYGYDSSEIIFVPQKKAGAESIEAD